jgi:hypothetical protein
MIICELDEEVAYDLHLIDRVWDQRGCISRCIGWIQYLEGMNTYAHNAVARPNKDNKYSPGFRKRGNDFSYLYA